MVKATNISASVKSAMDLIFDMQQPNRLFDQTQDSLNPFPPNTIVSD